MNYRYSFYFHVVYGAYNSQPLAVTLPPSYILLVTSLDNLSQNQPAIMCFTEPPDGEPAVEPQPRRPSLSSHEREKYQPESRAELARHRRMRLTLLDLQRTIDPLIAAHAYNNRHSPLAGLPDEILLPIVAFCLRNDPIDVYCVRRVSTRFRRIVYEPDIRIRVLNPPWSRAWSYSEGILDLALQRVRDAPRREGVPPVRFRLEGGPPVPGPTWRRADVRARRHLLGRHRDPHTDPADAEPGGVLAGLPWKLRRRVP